MTDLQQGFAEAQRALQAGEAERASAVLAPLIAAHPEQPALHLLAGVAFKKRGMLAEAREAFEAGIARHGGIAALHAELASLLDDLGEPEAAVASYDRAIALAPDLIDARIDRALVVHKRIDPEAGYDELRRLTAEQPGSARLWLNVAVAARSLGRLEEAAEATDRTLEIAPDAAKALRLRAQLAIDLGRPAVHLFRKARDVDPDNPEAVRGEAAALLVEGRRDEAIALIEERLAADPGWYDGHHMLAQIRWQANEGEAFVRSYREALRRRPRDVRLWCDYGIVSARAFGQEAMLPIVGEARRAAGDDPMFDALEANAHAELGALDRARPLYGRLANREEPQFALPMLRFLIRAGAFDEAQARGMRLVRAGHGPEAWPYVAIAWRMMDDPRWLWLEGERDLPQVFDLDALKPELPALAERLRSLHRWQVHPFEQSLRGGTQTDNVLFAREEPEIRSLVGHIRRAVREYIEGLPPPDPDHPVLSRPRGSFRFTGSWSVRLSGSGFHINHYHNEGWISSALYVALPEEIGDDRQHGWLTLGEPPAELGLDLPPVKLVKPEPGRLALFPSIMWHGTRPFSAGERLTVAFDVAPVIG